MFVQNLDHEVVHDSLDNSSPTHEGVFLKHCYVKLHSQVLEFCVLVICVYGSLAVLNLVDALEPSEVNNILFSFGQSS